MVKMYCFKSTVEHDVVNNLNIFTTSAAKALGLAIIYFAKNKCKGSPVRLAL